MPVSARRMVMSISPIERDTMMPSSRFQLSLQYPLQPRAMILKNISTMKTQVMKELSPSVRFSHDSGWPA